MRSIAMIVEPSGAVRLSKSVGATSTAPPGIGIPLRRPVRGQLQYTPTSSLDG
jgi:hypothetical protein